MDRKQQKFFKKKILVEIESFQIKITELKEATKPIAPDVAIGRISRMDAINKECK